MCVGSAPRRVNPFYALLVGRLKEKRRALKHIHMYNMYLCIYVCMSCVCVRGYMYTHSAEAVLFRRREAPRRAVGKPSIEETEGSQTHTYVYIHMYVCMYVMCVWVRDYIYIYIYIYIALEPFALSAESRFYALLIGRLQMKRRCMYTYVCMHICHVCVRAWLYIYTYI